MSFSFLLSLSSSPSLSPMISLSSLSLSPRLNNGARTEDLRFWPQFCTKDTCGFWNSQIKHQFTNFCGPSNGNQEQVAKDFVWLLQHPKFPRTHTHIYTPNHTPHTRTHPTPTHTHTHTHTPIHPQTHTHIPPHTHAHAHTHTYIHAHTHAHTHTHTHTHTHIHTQIDPLWHVQKQRYKTGQASKQHKGHTHARTRAHVCAGVTHGGFVVAVILKFSTFLLVISEYSTVSVILLLHPFLCSL